MSIAAQENSRIPYKNKFITIRCSQNSRLEAFIDWGQYLNDGRINVEYRFDDGERQLDSSSASTEGVATFFRNANPVIRQMIAGRTMRARAENFRRTPTNVATFSLIGFTKAFKAACSYHPEYKAFSRSVAGKPLSSAKTPVVTDYAKLVASDVAEKWTRPIRVDHACTVDLMQDDSGGYEWITPVSCGVENSLMFQSVLRAAIKAAPYPKPVSYTHLTLPTKA